MAQLWIVHRDPRWRDALRSLAGSLEVLDGHPADAARFAAAPAPRAVLLGVAADFEAELEFAHRHAPRLRRSRWVLLARSLDAPEVERLFDALPATIVTLESDARTLRRRLRLALARRTAAALTVRRRRDALASRFGTWLGDLDLPELLALSDPARAELPLLVLGEPGTGRGLLARYVHAMTAQDPASPFVALPCAPDVDPLAALARAAAEIGDLPNAAALATVCFEDVDQLEPPAQRALRAAIEHGAAAGGARWMATASDVPGSIEPELERALSGLVVHLPPLRERPAAIDALVAATGRSFSDDAMAHLRAHPWPGNLSELEALLRRSTAARRSDPITADDLHFEPAILDVSSADPIPFLPRQEGTLEGPASRGAEGAGARSASAREASAVNGLAGSRSEPEESEAHQARFTPGNQRVSSGSTHDDTPPRAEDSPKLEPSPPHPPERSFRRLSTAIAHEVGNPLVGIRTYAAMLPSHFDDPEFRAQFRERVEADTRRIESVVETLVRLGNLPEPARRPVDVSSLLARLLESERPQIRDRRLVVLEELDRSHPEALVDAEQLGFALSLLLGEVLAWIPARGDLFVATRHRPATATSGAVLRIELRFRGAERGIGFGDHALAVAALEGVVQANGGTFALEDSPSSGETVLTIDLQA
jgi:DNA-binding NtrC family response regulator